jgi:hypothetical protein
MRNTTLKIMLLTLLSTVFLFAAQAQQAKSGPEYSILLSTNKTEATIGTHVLITTQQTNLSSAPISCNHYWYGSTARMYQYEVRDAEGNRLEEIAPSHPELRTQSGSWTFCKILPGESSYEQLDLNKLFHFEKPGKYSVQIYVAGVGKSQSETIKSNALAITILPVVTLPPGTVPNASLEVRMEKLSTPEYQIGEQVEIGVFLKNLSETIVDCRTKSNISISGAIDVSFKYDVRDEQGNVVNKSQSISWDSSKQIAQPCIIDRGEEKLWYIDLHDGFQFEHSGKYTVQVSRLITGKPEDGYIKSNSVSFTILPADNSSPAQK